MRALRHIYQDSSHFKVFLEKQKQFSIHQRNLQVLMTEIYKILNDIAPPIMTSLTSVSHKSIKSQKFSKTLYRKKNTLNYGLETLTYRAPAIWEKLPSKYVHAISLDEFKSKIKSWKCEICPCGLCKNYQPNLGYIN